MTVQNCVATGGKGLDVLMSQLLYRNCLHVANNSFVLRDEAIILLDLIITAKWNEIQHDERMHALQTMSELVRKNFHKATYLRVFLRLSDMWQQLDERLVEHLTLMMTINLIESSDHVVVYHSLKILQLFALRHYGIFVKSFDVLVESEVKVSQLVNRAVNNPKYFPFIKDYLKFLAMAPGEYIERDPVENLQIPKFFVIS